MCAIGKISHNYASESEAGRKRNMAIVETLFVELEQFFIECKIKIDGAAKRITGEFNTIDSGAVFWVNTAIILETDILVVHRRPADAHLLPVAGKVPFRGIGRL